MPAPREASGCEVPGGTAASCQAWLPSYLPAASHVDGPTGHNGHSTPTGIYAPSPALPVPLQ